MSQMKKALVVAEDLERVAGSIRDLVAALHSVPEPVKPNETKAEVEAKSDPQPTLEELRALLRTLAEQGKTADVKALIQTFGVERLTDVPKDQFAALHTQAKALAAKGDA
ncbi:hypothetical protein [Salisediminibacterium selenitireducens]|uniref:rRNA biogenesis protein rrp5 n=1 Tax=Bacillus selenitireducens (strain ATCC 700615 / DSM 15326 / MLS10) TaxID=439292 RepID=D6XZU7_BACIE|nr:hypothetical protein [Salisediminibacterium selenitireducens]ADI00449.1 hypothetical protein Bsel_2963 [[Bacillus] selenitireducens MLS10]